MDYKLHQRLLRILNHCPSLLLAECYKLKTNISMYNIRHYLAWFVDNEFHDLCVELTTHTHSHTPAPIRNTERNLICWMPTVVCIKLIKSNIMDSKKTFSCAVEENKLELVKAIHKGGLPTGKIIDLDIPSAARLDYMERGLNIRTEENKFGKLMDYLVANNLIYRSDYNNSYDPYNTFGYNTSSHYDTQYDNSIFMDYVLEHETELSDYDRSHPLRYK
ncbi:hypothetical protein E24_00322 [Faustovirus]|nr:hypothetical protein PRJ_Fausto_00304 [Faustovirus]AMN83242.1 hypothetical protein E24_00322 [Faustovirus]AMN84223.1 hypothetical protein D5a_00319 [Faustovirus]AMN85211.1 hypothetical protein E23_00321 [Faustovirus]QBR99212.1 hypothetical protein [Faustovirus mariensis]